jgi:hypothetical protein
MRLSTSSGESGGAILRYAKMRPVAIARIFDSKAKAASEVPQTKKQPRK